MTTLLIALRNILRNRRRSLTTLLAMTIGMVTILLFGGFSRDIALQMQTGYVQMGGHLQIQHKDYYLYGSGNPAAYGIADYEKVIDILRQDQELSSIMTVATPTLTLGGLAGNFTAGVSRTILGAGVVVPEQNQMRLWNDYNVSLNTKPMALTGTPEDAAVIGAGVARVLQLCGALNVTDCPAPTVEKPTGPQAPADIAVLSQEETRQPPKEGEAPIELLAANVHGAPNVAALRVVKAEKQGVKEFDDIYVGMHLPQAQRLVYGRDTPQATSIVLQLKHTADIPQAKARFGQLLTASLKGYPLVIQDFEFLNPSYGQIIGMFSAIFGFMAILIGAIVLFTVSNTMSMSVVERTTEIGTLRALGLRRMGIRWLFVSEGLLLGLIGAAIGIIITLLLGWQINHGGLTWSPPGQIEPIPLTVRIWGETNMIMGAAINLIFVSVISSWWPARHAARLNIVDALRHV